MKRILITTSVLILLIGLSISNLLANSPLEEQNGSAKMDVYSVTKTYIHLHSAV